MTGELDSSPNPQGPESTAAWRKRITLAVFAAAAAYFLLTEHLAHTIQALPWVLVLLCPLMHLFMHRGHGHHGSGRGDASNVHGPDGGRR